MSGSGSIALTWADVQPQGDEVLSAGFGDADRWRKWCAIAWEHLAARGLTTASNAIGVYRVRLRAFSLAWLIYDFCEATYGEEQGGTPYWCDWLVEFRIDPTAAISLATASADFRSWLSEYSNSQPTRALNYDEYFDSEFAEEVAKNIVVQAALCVAISERPAIVAALIAGFGDSAHFGATMWEPTRSRAERERRADELQAEYFQPIHFGDTSDAERLAGFDWIETGCEVLVNGQPSREF